MYHVLMESLGACAESFVSFFHQSSFSKNPSSDRNLQKVPRFLTTWTSVCSGWGRVWQRLWEMTRAKCRLCLTRMTQFEVIWMESVLSVSIWTSDVLVTSLCSTERFSMLLLISSSAFFSSDSGENRSPGHHHQRQQRLALVLESYAFHIYFL